MSASQYDRQALPDSPAALIELMNEAAAKLTEVSFASMSSDEILAAAEINEQMRARVEAATTSLIIEVNDQFAFHGAGFQTVQKYMATGLRFGRSRGERAHEAHVRDR